MTSNFRQDLYDNSNNYPKQQVGLKFWKRVYRCWDFESWNGVIKQTPFLNHVQQSIVCIPQGIFQWNRALHLIMFNIDAVV